MTGPRESGAGAGCAFLVTRDLPRPGSAIGGLALAAVVALAGLILAASPVGAETQLDARVATDGHSAPYRPALVTVVLDADRAERGIVRVTGDDDQTVEREVDLVGDGPVEITVAVPIGDRREVTVRWVGDDTEVQRVPVGTLGGDELVGALPSARGVFDGAVAGLSSGDGVARVVDVDLELLRSLPQAVHSFDQLVGTPEGVSGLPAEVTAELAQWLHRGGRLVVVGDAEAADRVAGSLTGRDAGVVGLGAIAAVGSAPDGSVETQPTAEAGLPFTDAFDLGGGQGLGRTTSFPLPSFALLVGIAGAFALLAGPVLRLVLGRRGQEMWWWLIVPVAATVAAGAILVLGSTDQGGEGRLSTVSVVEYTDAGVFASTEFGIAGRGGEVEVTVDQSWRMGLAPHVWDDSGVGLTMSGSTIRTQGLGDGTATGRVTGPVDAADSPLRIEAETGDDGAIGRVTNVGDSALSAVAVADGVDFVRIGSLEPGESAEFDFSNARSIEASPETMRNLLADPRVLPTADLEVAEYAAQRWLVDAGFFYLGSGAEVVAIAWDEDADTPLGILDTGVLEPVRHDTLVVTRAPVAIVDPAGWRAASIATEGVPAELGGGGFADVDGRFRTSTWHHLPDDRPPGDLVLTAGRRVTAVSVWSGTEWVRSEGSGPILLSAGVTEGEGVAVVAELTDPWWESVENVSVAVRARRVDEAVTPLSELVAPDSALGEPDGEEPLPGSDDGPPGATLVEDSPAQTADVATDAPPSPVPTTGGEGP